jgi:hypothetical protein
MKLSRSAVPSAPKVASSNIESESIGPGAFKAKSPTYKEHFL